MKNKQELLCQIGDTFQELYDEYGEPEVVSPMDIGKIEENLRIWGVVYIESQITEYSWNEYLEKLVMELSFHLFGTPDPFDNGEYSSEYEKQTGNTIDKKIKAFAKWWNSKNGFGNCNFRFLVYQYMNNPPQFNIGKESIYFSRNPFHRHNIDLLSTNPQLWNILKTFHPPGKAMVSWDSTKLRIHHPKATKPGLTKRHRDVYNYDGQPLDRKQAMLIKQESGAISLGWVIFSHHPKIQKLLKQYLSKDPDRFSSVEDPDLNPIVDKWWRSIDTCGFVIWEQQTIHFEALANTSVSNITTFKSFSQPSSAMNKNSIRVVIGSHQPHKLTQEELKKLAYLSENGWCPAVYNNKNKGTNVSVNTVNKKSTQWKKSREMTETEEVALEDAREGFDECKIIGLSKIKREMYGLYM